VLDSSPIAFRSLAHADLPLLHRWLNTPHVLEWWDRPGPSLEQVQEEYFPRTEGQAPTHCYLILYDDAPIGFIQTYLIRDHPEYSRHVQVEDAAAGLDLLIGDPAYVHRGLGAAILRCFLRDVVFVRPDVESCVIGPAVTNEVAIRAYEKAGFTYLKTVQIPNEEEPEYLMRIAREDLSHNSAG
jgi:RimJ/RimL family protein N-acetyltransferase